MSAELRGATRLLVVRHGKTTVENGAIAGGSIDVPLGAQGREQSRLLAQRLEHAKIDLIVSSDMLRTQATVQPLAEQRGLPIITTPLLRERVYGASLEGNKSEEKSGVIFDSLMNYWLTGFKDRKHGRVVSDMESDHELMKRVTHAMHDIAKNNPNKTVLIASHYDVISTFLPSASLTESHEIYDVKNTGSIVVDFKNGGFNLLEINGVNRFA
jgi:probable phosphoglycerate mutase